MTKIKLLGYEVAVYDDEGCMVASEGSVSSPSRKSNAKDWASRCENKIAQEILRELQRNHCLGCGGRVMTAHKQKLGISTAEND